MSGPHRTIGVCTGQVLGKSVQLAQAIRTCKMVRPDGDYVRAARAVGIAFGDRP